MPPSLAADEPAFRDGMSMMRAMVPVRHLAYRAGAVRPTERMVPEECPVALSYGGTTHAVMMASPADLEDFAVGFSVTEDVVQSAEDLEGIHIERLDQGIDIQIALRESAGLRFQARRRRLAGPVGCGLCGIESIEEAVRRAPAVAPSPLRFAGADIIEAVRLLSERQPLHQATGAVHAAGFYIPDIGMVAIREDVGRHNALDKLAGALVRQRISGSAGAAVITSRVSVEMVQKAAVMGCPVIAAVSAPTALAVRTADAAGITLAALVRGDDFDVFTHPHRIATEVPSHVDS